MGFTPCILKEEERPKVAYDIFSSLLGERIIYLGDEINDESANSVVGQLLHLDSVSHEPIRMYINSPGGIITSGYAILDAMDLVKSPVYTVAIGQACSMAAVLLSCGEKGHRYILPHARAMIHQPSGGSVGQSSDVQIVAKQMDVYKHELASILADNTGQPLKKVLKDSDRDCWMTASEAVAYGLVDKVITKKETKKKKSNEEE